MLGDFGEVYVLDWGLAKILGAALGGDDAAGPQPRDSAPLVEEQDSLSSGTQHGALLGTPGYMSPEQCQGELDALGPPSDVYSLGCILFEILHLEPLHPGRGIAERLASTLSAATVGMLRAPARPSCSRAMRSTSRVPCERPCAR